MSSVDQALQGLRAFFDQTIREHGATPKGVDWNSQESQFARFQQLLKLHPDPAQPLSLLDFGCGYGGLIHFLTHHGYTFTYLGYDMTPSVIQVATQTFHHLPHCRFTTDLTQLVPQEYVIGSGLFNMKFAETPADDWYQHMLATLRQMWELAQKGMAFNALTSYSDPDYMRADLYYADPLAVFDFCKRHLSRQVALLHDYTLYDFTILVRR